MNIIKKTKSGSLTRSTILSVFMLIAGLDLVSAQTQYLVQPGDVLGILVWQEPDLTSDVTVHPDGLFTSPLIGELQASNRPISEIQKDVTKSLNRYIPDPTVTISLKESVGNQIYVIGQVNSPGVFNVTQLPDVMQALSLAGGMTAYASQNKINILRRDNEKQTAIGFRYGDVEKGESLEQNIILQHGDVVVVP